MLPISDMDAAHDWIRHHSRYAGICLRLAFNAPLTDFGCSGLGLLVTVVSFFQFSKLLSGNPSPFALCYTIGNILSLGATMFLVGNYRYSLWLFFRAQSSACRACQASQADVCSKTMDRNMRVRMRTTRLPRFTMHIHLFLPTDIFSS